MKIVILGYIVRGPLGGLAWHHFQYVLGLKSLGYKVLFLEDSDNFSGCYNPLTDDTTNNPGYGLEFTANLFNAYNLKDNWSYFDAHTNSWFGLSQKKVFSFCSSSDIVLNLSGVNPLRNWWAGIPIRVFIDTDPGFTQIKHLTEPSANELSHQHTHHFSFAENIGNKSCTIPDDGFVWKVCRQPIYLEAWKISAPMPSAKWTTVMQWDSYKARDYKGQTFGMKSLSFQPYNKLPELLPDEQFELALGSATAPSEELKQKGWDIINPLTPTKTPWTYQQYLAQSKGEWSVSKQGYVASNSGWFSERTLCYMATGRPVVVQNTGFTNFLPSGEGLLPFSTLEEAVEQINKVNKDFVFHCIQSRKIVEAFFDSEKVLSSFIKDL